MSSLIPQIGPETLTRIIEHAEQEYPSECCGLLFSKHEEPNKIVAIQCCVNAQDIYHESDPRNFPRTSKNAHFIEPRELLRAHKAMREKKEQIRVIYHSHPDAGVYFSDEDKRQALSGGEPLYPGTDYLVVSVMKGKALEFGIFRWTPAEGEFLEVMRQSI